MTPPPVPGEGQQIADVNAAAGFVQPRLAPMMRQPHRAAFDQISGQSPRLHEPRAPQPDVDAAGVLAQTFAFRRERRRLALAGGAVSTARMIYNPFAIQEG